MAQMSSFAFQRSTKNEDEKAELDKAFKDPKQMDKLIEKKLKSTKMKPEGRLMQFVKDALKLAYSLSGKNTTNFEKKDMKFVSPRFFGVVKENKKEDEVREAATLCTQRKYGGGPDPLAKNVPFWIREVQKV
uniref:Protein C10 n=1 Tax=Bursaphelenchus xylophilus TaxID=6326 RepID=A0A1I7SK62_BURXY